MEANPDRALLGRFVAGGGQPLAFDASPLAATLGAELREADLAAGRLLMAFRPGAGFLQGASVLQGGAIAAMLDFVIAGVVMLGLPEAESASTASLTISFLAPAPPGSYFAEGLIERRGRRVVFASGKLRHVDADRVVASATAVMAIRPGPG